MANTNQQNQMAIVIEEHYPMRGVACASIVCSCSTIQSPVRFDSKYKWAMHLTHTLTDAAAASIEATRTVNR